MSLKTKGHGLRSGQYRRLSTEPAQGTVVPALTTAIFLPAMPIFEARHEKLPDPMRFRLASVPEFVRERRFAPLPCRARREQRPMTSTV
jgi:hypothetical protein